MDRSHGRQTAALMPKQDTHQPPQHLPRTTTDVLGTNPCLHLQSGRLSLPLGVTTALDQTSGSRGRGTRTFPPSHTSHQIHSNHWGFQLPDIKIKSLSVLTQATSSSPPAPHSAPLTYDSASPPPALPPPPFTPIACSTWKPEQSCHQGSWITSPFHPKLSKSGSRHSGKSQDPQDDLREAPDLPALPALPVSAVRLWPLLILR